MPKMRVLSCPACGAPIAPGTQECPYCQRYLYEEPDLGRSPSGSDPGEPQRDRRDPDGTYSGVLLQRLAEPREGAFTISVPHGWQLDGGIIRVDFTQQAINAQFIEAKIDFSVKRDDQGTTAIRWCPEVKYCDMRYSLAGAFFPRGSSYQGMVVMPAMSAAEFLIQVAFPWAHPNATNAEVARQSPEPLLVEAYRKRAAAFGIPVNFTYDGAVVEFSYTENGIRFHEKAYTIIENMGAIAAGMWSNKDTLLLRAPEGELSAAEPLLHHIQESAKLDHAWIAREIASQEILTKHFLNAQQAEQARNRRMLEIQQQIQQIDHQIAENRARTNAEIHNDAYLTLMDQEEYVNPHTGEVETGSNQWTHRWVTDGGEEFYTDYEDDDPNTPGLLNRTDWKRTPVRPRFPSG
jgi:hypothetical protein